MNKKLSKAIVKSTTIGFVFALTSTAWMQPVFANEMDTEEVAYTEEINEEVIDETNIEVQEENPVEIVEEIMVEEEEIALTTLDIEEVSQPIESATVNGVKIEDAVQKEMDTYQSEIDQMSQDVSTKDEEVRALSESRYEKQDAYDSKINAYYDKEEPFKSDEEMEQFIQDYVNAYNEFKQSVTDFQDACIEKICMNSQIKASTEENQKYTDTLATLFTEDEEQTKSNLEEYMANIESSKAELQECLDYLNGELESMQVAVDKLNTMTDVNENDVTLDELTICEEANQIRVNEWIKKYNIMNEEEKREVENTFLNNPNAYGYVGKALILEAIAVNNIDVQQMATDAMTEYENMLNAKSEAENCLVLYFKDIDEAKTNIADITMRMQMKQRFINQINTILNPEEEKEDNVDEEDNKEQLEDANEVDEDTVDSDEAVAEEKKEEVSTQTKGNVHTGTKTYTGMYMMTMVASLFTMIFAGFRKRYER